MDFRPFLGFAGLFEAKVDILGFSFQFQGFAALSLV